MEAETRNIRTWLPRRKMSVSHNATLRNWDSNFYQAVLNVFNNRVKKGGGGCRYFRNTAIHTSGDDGSHIKSPTYLT